MLKTLTWFCGSRSLVEPLAHVAAGSAQQTDHPRQAVATDAVPMGAPRSGGQCARVFVVAVDRADVKSQDTQHQQRAALPRHRHLEDTDWPLGSNLLQGT